MQYIMRASDYAKQDHVGERVVTQAMGDWPGGEATVTEMLPDREGAPEIVMQVRRDDGDECGVFEYEYVGILASAPASMSGE